jgi:hypothetical protein
MILWNVGLNFTALHGVISHNTDLLGRCVASKNPAASISTAWRHNPRDRNLDIKSRHIRRISLQKKKQTSKTKCKSGRVPLQPTNIQFLPTIT